MEFLKFRFRSGVRNSATSLIPVVPYSEVIGVQLLIHNAEHLRLSSFEARALAMFLQKHYAFTNKEGQLRSQNPAWILLYPLV